MRNYTVLPLDRRRVLNEGPAIETDEADFVRARGKNIELHRRRRQRLAILLHLRSRRNVVCAGQPETDGVIAI